MHGNHNSEERRKCQSCVSRHEMMFFDTRHNFMKLQIKLPNTEYITNEMSNNIFYTNFGVKKRRNSLYKHPITQLRHLGLQRGFSNSSNS